jgi:hypothetical protein
VWKTNIYGTAALAAWALNRRGWLNLAASGCPLTLNLLKIFRSKSNRRPNKESKARSPLTIRTRDIHH